MRDNTSIWIGMAVGSILGGYIPLLWEADSFSMSSIIFTALGGFIGIWIGYKCKYGEFL